MRASSMGQIIELALARNRRAVVGVAGGVALLGLALALVGQASVSLMFVLLAAMGASILYLAGLESWLTGVIVAVAIFVDFYEVIGLPLREPVVAIVCAAALLVVMFLGQTRSRPWARVSGLGYWAVLLAVAGLAIPRGAVTETSYYFLTVFLGPLLMYILGTQVARDGRRLVWLLGGVSAVAAFIAIHSIIQGVTGVFLFATLRQVDYLGSVSGFHLAGFSISRAGSFLQNPDWNGAYLAFSFFPLAGLFLAARSVWGRVAAATGGILTLVALLFTFTTASWLAFALGAIILVWRVVPRRYLKRTLIGAGAALVVFGALFSFQVRALFLHATTNREFTLRIGAWETALRIIRARPLTGIGMNPSIYVVAAEPYRVPWQTRPLAHPHNSYLELAAFAGIPLLLAFLALLFVTLRTVDRQWRRSPVAVQPLIGGVFTALVVLSANSVAINGWTLAPLAMIGWLLAGAASGRFREPHDASQPAIAGSKRLPEPQLAPMR